MLYLLHMQSLHPESRFELHDSSSGSDLFACLCVDAVAGFMLAKLACLGLCHNRDLHTQNPSMYVLKPHPPNSGKTRNTLNLALSRGFMRVYARLVFGVFL